MSDKPLIHLIDDDAALLDSVGLLLATEGFAVKTYRSAEEFLMAGGATDAGCVVTDVRMTGMSGIDLLSRMKEREPALPTIIITAHADIPLAVRAMKQGAADLLEKPFRAEDLISSIRQAFAQAADEKNGVPVAQADLAKFESLSAREREVLEGLLRGQPNKIIAHELGISQRTVEIHRANVMRKTRAGSLAELVRMTLSFTRN